MRKQSQWHMRASAKDLQDIARLAKLLKVKEAEAVRIAIKMMLGVKMEEVIKLLKERILLAEKKKGEYDTLEMDSFWDGQMRCAQDMLNKVSRLTKRPSDECLCSSDKKHSWKDYTMGHVVLCEWCGTRR